MRNSLLLPYYILFCCLFFSGGVFSQPAGKGTQYMFCIGINNYLAGTNPANCQVCKDRGIKNLTGCVNDVDTISRLFIKYYGFKPEQMILLRDQQASRAAIQQTFDQLLAKCKKGDYLVFFYSGHGSYEFEKENDGQLRTGKGYRNTILPADVTKPGIRDFNSAELNKIFSGFTDKGVVLTVITDCCHSATNTRGSTLFEVDSAREVKPSLEIRQGIAAGEGITRKLDQSGALTIGSCQDNEIAGEAQIFPKVFYGAFTISLCRSVTEWSQAPIDVLLDRTRSKIRLLNKIQTPNMEASQRLGMNLAGTAPAQLRKTFYTLKCADCSANKLPVIAAGFTDDLYNNDILVDTKTKDSITVSNLGFTETEVTLINKSKLWKVQDFMSLNFRVLKKIPNPDPPLKIFLGNPVNVESYAGITENAAKLLQQKDIAYQWMNPSLDNIPDAVLFYRNGWKLNRNRITETVTLDSLGATQINELMELAKIKKAYLQLPPPMALTDQLKEKLAVSKNRNIQVVDAASAADYILAGHLLQNNGIAYGWEKTVQANQQKDDGKKAGLPALTDFFPVSGSNAYPVDSLTERVNRLSVLANWLSMKSPPADKSLVFPYHLAIKNLGNKQKADDKTMAKSNTEDKLDISIEKDAGSKLSPDSIHPLFIYVMSMDPKGNTYLLYPQPRSSILTYPNSVLRDSANNNYHLATVRHTTPGSYHYFFIALREAVSSRDVFTRHGVVKGDQQEFYDNPLEALLNEGGTEQRGDIKSFDHWLLRTVDIVTENKTIKKN